MVACRDAVGRQKLMSETAPVTHYSDGEHKIIKHSSLLSSP